MAEKTRYVRLKLTKKQLIAIQKLLYSHGSAGGLNPDSNTCYLASKSIEKQTGLNLYSDKEDYTIWAKKNIQGLRDNYNNWVKNNPDKRRTSKRKYEEKRKLKRKQAREEKENNKYF